jgi:hypothetical protein
MAPCCDWRPCWRASWPGGRNNEASLAELGTHEVSTAAMSLDAFAELVGVAGSAVD